MNREPSSLWYDELMRVCGNDRDELLDDPFWKFSFMDDNWMCIDDFFCYFFPECITELNDDIIKDADFIMRVLSMFDSNDESYDAIGLSLYAREIIIDLFLLGYTVAAKYINFEDDSLDYYIKEKGFYKFARKVCEEQSSIFEIQRERFKTPTYLIYFFITYQPHLLIIDRENLDVSQCNSGRNTEQIDDVYTHYKKFKPETRPKKAVFYYNYFFNHCMKKFKMKNISEIGYKLYETEYEKPIFEADEVQSINEFPNKLFTLMVLINDEYFEKPDHRFFNIATRLHLDVMMVLAHHTYMSGKSIIRSKDVGVEATIFLQRTKN